MTERWIRSQRAAVVELGERLALVARDGSVRALDGDSAELARAVLAQLDLPRTRGELVAQVEALAGPLGDRTRVVDELIALLRETGAVADTAALARAHAPRTEGRNIVVAISGALAASHAPALVTALQRRGHTVEVAVTPTAQRFVALDALAALVQRAVHTSMWPHAPHAPVPHVALAEWAELVIVYPASATTIARLARGDCSELVAALALCTRAPVVVAPSMNAGMHDAPAVARNLDQLRGDGFAIVHGVPSQEAADPPHLRTGHAGVAVSAPSPTELAATLDALLAANALGAPAVARETSSTTAASWDRRYRAAHVPWVSDTCDPDLAAALAAHAPPHARVLDVGCGLGQIARHAAAAGHRVVATDISELALAAARARSAAADIVFVRDDITATALVGPFDVVVDRAVLHTLSAARAAGYAAAMRRLVAPGGTLLLKVHRSVAAATHLAGFERIAEQPAELPGLTDPAPIPSILVTLRRS